MKTQTVKLQGRVIKELPDAHYKVYVKEKIDKDVLCYLSGKLVSRYIKPNINDWVEIEISPLDTSKGRIIRKL